MIGKRAKGDISVFHLINNGGDSGEPALFSENPQSRIVGLNRFLIDSFIMGNKLLDFMALSIGF